MSKEVVVLVIENLFNHKRITHRLLRAFFGLEISAIVLIWKEISQYGKKHAVHLLTDIKGFLLTPHFLRKYPTLEEVEIFGRISRHTFLRQHDQCVALLYLSLNEVKGY